jgi:hypothetical protein
MYLRDVVAWCKKQGYQLCDNLDVNCTCDVTHLDEAKGYKGRMFQICSNCYTTKCPACHEFCDDSYPDGCYECDGPCDDDEDVCSFRREYKISIQKDDFFFEKCVCVHDALDEKEYVWKDDKDVEEAVTEYIRQKVKRSKASDYYDSLFEYFIDTADKKIEEK